MSGESSAGEIIDPIPQAAVILPHFNDVVRLRRCLAALLPQQTGLTEVIVVDNGSRQSLDGIRRDWPGLRIVCETARGAAAARNRGVRETRAPWLFFLDSDCVPSPDWLATALRHAREATADLIGGSIEVFDETPPPRSGAQAFETVFAFDNRGYIERKGFSVTANLLTRREVFVSVGDFTPGLSEDLDWCHRARALGYSLIHAADLRVSHPTRSDWAALRQKWRRVTQELCAVNGHTVSARARWGLRGLAMLLSIPAHLPKVMVNRHLSARDRVVAAATLARLRAVRCGWMLRQAFGGQI